MEKYSVDPIESIELKITQPEDGYHFSMDPFLLAAHALQIHTVSSNITKTLDIGCGCGIISLLLAKYNKNLKVIGIEIQDELFHHAVTNVLINKMHETINIIHADIHNITCTDINGPFDLILSNPPYIKKISGRKNLNPQKAIARHEITMDMDDLFKCSKTLLKEKGSFHLIYPAERIGELITTANHNNITPSVIRFVHIKKTQDAKLVLFSAIKGGNVKPVIPSPLYIYSSDNTFSNEYISMISTLQ